MSRLPIIIIIISLFGSVGYEHYRTISLIKNISIMKKEADQEKIIYDNEIKTLQDNIENQSNQIKSMKDYISNVNNLNDSINDLKKDYSKIKHDSQSITKFQNSLFDKFGE